MEEEAAEGAREEEGRTLTPDIIALKSSGDIWPIPLDLELEDMTNQYSPLFSNVYHLGVNEQVVVNGHQGFREMGGVGRGRFG